MMAIAKHVEVNGLSDVLEMTPTRVFWGCHDTPLGPVMLGVNEDNAICKIAVSSGYGTLYDLSAWKDEWPDTEFLPDASRTARHACRISQMNMNNISLASCALYGSSYLLRILKGMLNVPENGAISFSELNRLVRQPFAA